MEGLIRGLADVVFNPRDDADDDTRDQRSRSTWAEVVGGEQEEDDTSRRPSRHTQAQRQEMYDQTEQRQSGRKEVYESGGSRPTPTTHEYGDTNDDGWETVGQKRSSKTQHKVPKNQWNSYKRPLSEQEYSSDVDYGTSTEPSEEELADLSKALNKLWDLDLNRLVPGKDYEIDCGEGKKVYQKEDVADASLFTWLSDDIFRRPTYSRFCALLDNYNPEQGCKEVVTSEEKQEQKAFIEEISRTAVIKYLHKYLSAKGIISENHEEFKRMLASFWFDLYGRGGTSGSSSAFEHVFVGEIKQRGEQEVSGFHNWIQFYLEEAKGRVNYQGYIFPRRRGSTPDSESHLLTIQFEWNGVLKSVSSTLVGVSPEFEFAIYTLCFYMGQEENHVELGPYPVNIKCYRLGNKIGSAFPVADS
ncbi:uncharacterized protein LOC130992797 [Salvia miltiorrhiza]|uniref:uncharacterized protein LOC130992797 n=1 Tax=Salvia miltiorrhiza TaxID=226208 RepID=UPI0025AC2494|nr:uncharacterized protein LOC130992797 [Salvia miltiorrhiza]